MEPVHSGVATHVIDGIAVAPFMTPKSLRQGLDFVARKGDLLQVTYPKSGTHWLLYITQLILKEDEPIGSYEELLGSTRFIEYELDAPEYKSSTEIRSLCTHLPLRKDKLNPEAKYIYLARNPWDVCDSCYRQEADFGNLRPGESAFDEFLEKFLTGQMHRGCYFQHLMAGYSLRDEPNVLFLTYEQLKRDTRATVLALARFLGTRYEKMLQEADGDGRVRLHSLLQRISADNMRKVLRIDLLQTCRPVLKKLADGLISSSKASQAEKPGTYSFTRKAQIGSWKERFSPENLRAMEACIAEKTRGSDVMNLWSDIRAEALSRC
ncbi:hypothetical protein HPB50_017357 [Hyalomma asiaticum]|uniref:Uncharacterized protein n=1 Tax=Hyalomma asiaticum TaxID=266040 RepID=A0ACB7SGG4_HYAAI|nr:hypothetical protein HPB50_017357 [Hyalomma asiaticum]